MPEAPTLKPGNPLNRRPKKVGGVRIPSGLTLIMVRNPAGTDAGQIFYLAGKAFGVDFAFEIGSRKDFAALFGGEDGDFAEALAAFEGVTKVSQAGFDREYLSMGSVDEILGATESLGAQLERELRGLGIESLPEWMRNSKQALTIQAIGAAEGWSAGRIASELAKTGAFKKRYSAFGTVAAALGTDDVLAVTEKIATMESEIRDSLREYRNQTEVSSRYLQKLIGSGWSSGEVGSLLEAEYRLGQTPGALDNLNEFLTRRGQEPLSKAQMAQFMSGNAPTEAFEMVNDALRQAALQSAGLKIGSRFAESLGDDGALRSVDPGSFTESAAMAAQVILEFGLEVDAGKYGLKRRDIIKAAFGEGRTAEVDAKLAKYARERAEQAQGLGGRQSYIGSEGELRVQGLEGL